MANEYGSDDRLTRNEFAELIQHLSVQEILTIEYRIGTKWNKLFLRKHLLAHIYFCNLCVLETSSFKNLLAHIDGRKHKLQMERVSQLYHPDYTYPKNDKKEGIQKNVAKKNDDLANFTLMDVVILPTQHSVVSENDNEKSLYIEKSNTKSVANFDKNSNATNKSTTANVQYKLDNCMKTLTAINKKSEQVQGENKIEEENLETSAIKLHEAIKLKSITKVKRSLGDVNTEDVNLKKKKIVVNPAARVSSKANLTKGKEDKLEESSNKPQYQTDKVIIPTIHKNKSHNRKTSPPSTSQTQSNDPPKFCVKSYSSNPSDNDIHGILGVEYVIKILKTRNDVSPRYECGLCELVFDGFAMQRHLEGYNHRLKYCEKHFPTAIRQYRQYLQNVPEHEIFKVMTPVLVKLAVSIEQHHGRNLPYECYERDFSLNRHEILAKVFSCRHASEQYGPTFTHVVGSKEIDELICNRQNYMPPTFSRIAIFDMKTGSISNKFTNNHQNSKNSDNESNLRHRHAGRQNAITDDITYKSYMSSNINDDMYLPSSMYMKPHNRSVIQRVDDKTYNLMVDDFLKGTLKGISRNSALHEDNKRPLSPPRNLISVKRKSLSPLRQNDIWQAYRHMVDQELYNLNERFNQYRKDPETHPLYNEEWQTFWKRRKDELVTAGVDHRKHNYQPEWVRFVKIRIEELYSEEVEKLKIKSRERLCLPLTNDKIADVKYHVQVSKINSTNEFLPTVCNTEPTQVLRTTAPILHSSNCIPQVVSVLRLMTALEDSLGSLGPKVIDLLSKALQTEKTNPLLVNAIILNDENSSLIETAKEKLKGLVITGLFDGPKKRVLNQVVNDTEALLHYAYDFKQQLAFQRSLVETSTNRTQYNSFSSLDPSSASFSSSLKNQSSISNSLVTKDQRSSFSKTENLSTRAWEKTPKHMDKKELASKLAASLVAQGKTDFDPQQLQQLIAVYKLIEGKKRESSGSCQSNKSGCSLRDSMSSSKKTLSDTLSDLLKSSSSTYTTSAVSKMSNTSHSDPSLSNQMPSDRQFSSIVSSVYKHLTPTNPLTNNLQNSSGNNFNNTVQSVSNSFGSNLAGRSQLEQRSSFGINYLNNIPPNQRNFNSSTMYNNQYRHWGWNSNMEMNQNYNVAGPNNFNQTSSWQKF